MSVYLFTTIILFLLCSTSSFALTNTAGTPQPDSTTVQSVEIFKNDKCLETLKTSGGDGAAIKEIKNFDNVFFVTAGDRLVAVAEAKYTKTGNGGKDKYDFVSAYSETAVNWNEDIFKNKDDICSRWKTQLATNTENDKGFFTAKNVVYNSNEKKIYLFAVNEISGSDQWEYNIAFGNVSGENTPIKWTNKKLNIFNLEAKLKLTKQLIGSSSTDNGAFVTKDGKVIFILRAKDDQKSKHVLALIELKNSDKPELDVLHVENTVENCYPYLFLWGQKIVMITTNCGVGAEADNNVKESSTDLTQWDNSSGTFYHFSEFFKDKTSFTPADINSKTVLLFAKQNGKKCITENGEQKRNCFTFWFSDGNRVYNVGQNVFYDDNSPKFVSSSLIYAKEKLFFLHQHLDSDTKKFALTSLDKQLKNITETLEKWKSADGIVSDLCKAEPSHSETTCVGSLPPEGLVGFLSDKKENDKWEDKYLNVDAEVIGGAEINNGLICDSAGKGAKWPVSEGNENQAYNLKDPGFTLVAPVKISGNANQTNSILGVGLKVTATGGGQKSIGLWCSDKGKWAVGKGEEQPAELVQTSENCEHNETYLVVLMFNKEEKKLEVHIDGKKLEISLTEITNIDTTEAISYFYFGAGSKQNSVETHVTIKYVLLYNHPLDGNVIQKLKVPKKEKKVTNREENDGTNNTPGQQGDLNTEDKNVSKEGSGGTEKKQTSTTNTEDSAARVGVVGVLCFMLFGVFTLLGRYVY